MQQLFVQLNCQMDSSDMRSVVKHLNWACHATGTGNEVKVGVIENNVTWCL